MTAVTQGRRIFVYPVMPAWRDSETPLVSISKKVFPAKTRFFERCSPKPQQKSYPMENSDPQSPDSVMTKEIRRNPPLIMSLKEGATFLGVSVRKLRTDLKARRIPHVRLGGKILLRRDAVEAALQKLEVKSL